MHSLHRKALQIAAMRSLVKSIAVAAVFAMSSVQAVVDLSQIKMNVHDWDYLTHLAKHIVSQRALEVMKSPEKYSGKEIDLTAFTQGKGRKLGASDDECGIYLAASLSSSIWDCFDMATTVLSLVKEEKTGNTCQTTYDFSQASLSRICGNKCYELLLKSLTTMSEAGCSASILKQTCDECSEGTVCKDGACYKTCSAALPCSCEYTCEGGACIPPKNAQIQKANLGVTGYLTSLEYICTQRPKTDQYCFADVWSVVANVNPDTFCTNLAPLGCCTGTVFSWLTECATTNNTITTKVGTISLPELEQWCSQVDFQSVCSTATPIHPGSCNEGYFLSPAAPSARTTVLAAVTVFALFMVNMLL